MTLTFIGLGLLSAGVSAEIDQEGGTTQAISGGVSTFDKFECTFSVPAPPESGNIDLFLWCGIFGEKFGILQPVLMYGNNCFEERMPAGIGPYQDPGYSNDPYWYYSAQYVNTYPGLPQGNSGCIQTGMGFKAKEGDVLVSTFEYDHSAGSQKVSIALQDGSQLSEITVAKPTYWNPAGGSTIPLSWADVHEYYPVVAIEPGVATPFSTDKHEISKQLPARPSSWVVDMKFKGPPGFIMEVRQSNPKPLPDFLSCGDVDGDSTQHQSCTYDFRHYQQDHFVNKLRKKLRGRLNIKGTD